MMKHVFMSMMLLAALAIAVAILAQQGFPTASAQSSNTNTQISALSAQISLSANEIDAGQGITLAANAFGGAPPYTYEFYIYNYSTNSIVGASAVTSQNLSASFTWNAIPTGPTGELYANVLITDNSSQAASSNSVPFTVSQQLAFNSISLGANVISEGQEQTVTANITGGTPPYTYGFTISNSTSIVANSLNAGISLTSNSFSFTQNSSWGTGTFTVKVVAKDSLGESTSKYATYNSIQPAASSNATTIPTTTSTTISTVTTSTSATSTSTSILPTTTSDTTTTTSKTTSSTSTVQPTIGIPIKNITIGEIQNNSNFQHLFPKFISLPNGPARKVSKAKINQGIISQLGIAGGFNNGAYVANVTILYGNHSANVLKLVNTTVTSSLSKGKISSYASFVPKGAYAPILIKPDGILSGIKVKTDADISNISTNVNINNTLPADKSFGLPYYMTFHVNSTLNDSNVTEAVYNFSVSRAWINGKGISPSQVTLYKYISENKTWIPLPTSLVGSNLTSYAFSALSDSLSTYLVSYGQNGAHSDSASQLTVDLALPAGYKLYLCSAGASVYINDTPAPSWTADVNAPPGEAFSSLLVNASIGHQTSNTCKATMANEPYYGMTMAGIGVNATQYTLYTNSTYNAGSLKLPYTVSASNSLTIIMGAAGFDGGASITPPANCTSYLYSGNYSNAYVGVCQNQAAGNYIASATNANTTSTSLALAAYVFSPYKVTLEDNPSAANIITNGNTYTNGQSALLIGTGNIIANPPSTGNWAFNSWLVSNSLNLTVANTLNPSTALTVVGNGTLIATWKNETTKFVETGLPAPFTWNAVYNGVLASSSTNAISFTNIPGTYTFTISNQIINGEKYMPFPSSGSASTGNTIIINFTLEGKPALQVSSNPETYGNTDSVTVNALPSSDYVELDISGGIFGSSNTVAGPAKGSLLYTFPVVSPGTYTLNAIDTNTLESTTINLTVLKASPKISLPNFPSSFFYDGNTVTVTANILTYNNQLPMDVYVNNALVASANTQASVQVGPEIGNYVVTANTLGNANYTSESITKFFSIEPPPPKTVANYAGHKRRGTASTLTVSTLSAYKLYLCAGGAGGGAVTYTTGTADQYSTNDYAFIGHQSTNGCTETTAHPDLAEAIFGINDTTYTLQKSNGTSSASLVFNVVEPGSLVAIMISSGYYGFSSQPSIPSGCNELEDVTGADTFESAYVAVCPSLAAGSYTASVSLSGPGGAEIGAYIFPPNYVKLNDVPTTATMTVNGTTYSNDEDIILLGQTSANAIAPPSPNFVFRSWKASNSNITIANALSQNTLISATGNGTLTATWNGISTFTESGLPSSTAWNVIYDSILNASSANTISFSTVPGNFIFTVANQVSKGITYIPSPSTGYLAAGNITHIVFTPVKVCTISLAQNSINFGSIYAGSNVATIKTVTDNNIGNVNAYMLVYGGNWIGPSSFGVSNTTWSVSSGVAFPANRLSPAAYNTTILVPAGSSNDIYFGLGVPRGAPSGVYSQDITIENSC